MVGIDLVSQVRREEVWSDKVTQVWFGGAGYGVVW